MITDFSPIPADVKAKIPQRVGGSPFTNDTIPSIKQVEEIIGDITAEVVQFAGPIAEENYELAQYAIELGSAAEIEGTFFPEQSGGSDNATYARYIRRYREVLDQLKATGGGGAGTIPFANTLPDFPIAADVESPMFL